MVEVTGRVSGKKKRVGVFSTYDFPWNEPAQILKLGVVAVLDTRLGTAGYRWDLVNALPPMKRTRHQRDVIEFLERIRDEAETAQPVGGH